MNSDYLDTAAAAAILGVHPGTLANWRSQGRGPQYVRVGRRVRYTRLSLFFWTASRWRYARADHS